MNKDERQKTLFGWQNQKIFNPEPNTPLLSSSVGMGTMLLGEGGESLIKSSKSQEILNLQECSKKKVLKSPKIVFKTPKKDFKENDKSEKIQSQKSKIPKNRLKNGKTGEERAKSEMSFCHSEINLGQNYDNIKKNRPTILTPKKKCGQNDGLLDLVAAEGERGDPPKSTIF